MERPGVAVEEVAPPDSVVEPELALGLLAGWGGRAGVREVAVADGYRSRTGRRRSDAGQGSTEDDRGTEYPHSRTGLALRRLMADHLGLSRSSRRLSPACAIIHCSPAHQSDRSPRKPHGPGRFQRATRARNGLNLFDHRLDGNRGGPGASREHAGAGRLGREDLDTFVEDIPPARLQAVARDALADDRPQHPPAVAEGMEV